MKYLTVLSLFIAATALVAQQPATPAPEAPKPTTAAEAPTRDSSYIDENGAAHVTRVVPVPDDLSMQSQFFLRRREPDAGPPQSLEERRKMTDAYTAGARQEWTAVCPNTIAEET